MTNVSGPSNPPDELAQHVSKRIPFGRIIPPFFFESSESDRFAIIYMIRIRFFGSGELIQRTFRAARYKAAPKNNDIDLVSPGGSQRLLRRRTPHTHRTSRADVDRQLWKRVCTTQGYDHPFPRDRSTHGALGVHEQKVHDGLGRVVSANRLQGRRCSCARYCGRCCVKGSRADCSELLPEALEMGRVAEAQFHQSKEEV